MTDELFRGLTPGDVVRDRVGRCFRVLDVFTGRDCTLRLRRIPSKADDIKYTCADHAALYTLVREAITR